MNPKNNRRDFLKSSLAAGTVVSSLNAVAPSRILGANDRIRIGVIGTGGRGRWHIGWLHRTSEVEKLEITAVCDVWDVNTGERGSGSEEAFR
jgi:hypothetical protein